MPATVVMGGQWGDEGKGKLVDALAPSARLVVRANGGSNAGHTVSTDAGIFKMHLIPSGILYPDLTCVIGPGVVIDPGALLTEMDELTARGVSLDNLKIADRAHVVLPYHPVIDRLEEAARDEGEIGTTGRGNGPAYADKVARRGIRVTDLLDGDTLRSKVLREVAAHNRLLTAVYGAVELDGHAIYEQLRMYGDRLRPYVVPAEMLVQDTLVAGHEILIECAQGAMLDVDYGTYPYVTSSSPTAAGACQGAGVAPGQVRRVVAVFKAYSTRVGAGPLPTELHDATGAAIRERGREYGTTTGRPRRTGWFDAVAARHVARLNGVTELVVTLLDVLDQFSTIKICTAYEVDGTTIDCVPANDALLARARPRYTEFRGWTEPTTHCRRWDDLPQEAQDYLRFIEQAVAAPLSIVGVGPGRDQLVSVGADALTLSTP